MTTMEKIVFDRTCFEYTDEEIRTLPKGRLLSLEIEFSRRCNYRCPYCYAASDDTDYSGELTDGEIRSAIRQAAELGARKIVILGGEPLLYPGLEEMIRFIRDLKLGVEIFTNGSLITRERAEMLFRNDCRVVVKFNTFDPEMHDRLTGRKNSLATAMRALDLLEEAGYGTAEDMLCATTVLTSENLDSAPAMWKYLRERRILPYFEMLTPQGRLLDHPDLLPDPEKVRRLFEQASEYDARHGIHWEPQPPLMGQKCFRHQYSCLIDHRGTVYPCVGLTLPIGSIREKELERILSESAVIARLKAYREHIKPPCRDCEKAEHCYGCRGAAWQTTGDYLAADPTCWKNAGRQAEIQTLPTSDLEHYLPHGLPMRFPGTMLRIHDRGGELRTVIRPDNLFLNCHGCLESAALIEIAAQTIAAFDGFLRNGENIPPGMLVEVKRFSSTARLRAGDAIHVNFHTTDDFEPWHIVEFRIADDSDRTLAEGALKLCISER